MKLEVQPNSYMDITLKMVKNLVFKRVFFMPGTMIYAYSAPKKLIFKISDKIPYFLFGVIIITSGLKAIEDPTRYDSIFAVLVALTFFVYNIKRNQLHIKRTEQADEMLSMWLIQNYPNEKVSSTDLLKGTAVSSNHLYFFLIITKEKAEVFVFEDPRLTGESAATLQPMASHILEYK